MKQSWPQDKVARLRKKVSTAGDAWGRRAQKKRMCTCDCFLIDFVQKKTTTTVDHDEDTLVSAGKATMEESSTDDSNLSAPEDLNNPQWLLVQTIRNHPNAGKPSIKKETISLPMPVKETPITNAPKTKMFFHDIEIKVEPLVREEMTISLAMPDEVAPITNTPITPALNTVTQKRQVKAIFFLWRKQGNSLSRLTQIVVLVKSAAS